MTRAARLVSSFVTIAVVAAGCNRSPIQPIAATTEMFTGTLVQQGDLSHPFTTKDEGPVSITVLSVVREVPALPEDTPAPDTSRPPSVEDDPTSGIPPPIYIGLAIGSWDGSACRRIAQRTDASLLTIISGTAQAGQFCVAVFDPGGDVVTLPVDYQIEVDHY